LKTQAVSEEKLARHAGEFERDGYTVLRSVFERDEIEILREAIVSNERMTALIRALRRNSRNIPRSRVSGSGTIRAAMTLREVHASAELTADDIELSPEMP
jgi:hypothetical protein